MMIDRTKNSEFEMIWNKFKGQMEDFQLSWIYVVLIVLFCIWILKTM